MKIYVTLIKHRAIAIAAFIIIAVSVAVQFTAAQNNSIYGKTKEQRLKFINDIGLSVSKSEQVKQISIPAEFSDVYTNYNNLQKTAGFDLSIYKGKKATIYSYLENNTDRKVSLIVCKGIIIGGDISESSLGGRMVALK